MNLIYEHINTITNLCKKHFVDELFVFGSILSDRFTEESDIDFLVKFSSIEPSEYFDNYTSFKQELETLLKRNIDLLEIQTIKNPILKRSVNRNKTLLYGREDSKMAV
jgi:predicted nucleotidyltransferase